jgi:alpha-galactosidase
MGNQVMATAATNETTGEARQMAKSRAIYDAYITNLGKLPFSFVYGETAYMGFPSGTFRQIEHKHSVQDNKESDCFVLKMGDLQVTVDTAFYAGYGAYEWTVWFENTGKDNTAVIRDMRAADMLFAGARPVLKGILGDHQNQYRPYARALEEAPVQFTSNNGRPTHIWFPYFNLEHGDGGTLIALGWGGTWEALFTADGNGRTRLIASGNNGLRTYLKPGEKIRSPLMAFLPYAGRDEARAINLWRRWFLECNLPKLNAKGDPVRPFSTTWLAGDTGLPNSDGSISERHFTWRPSLEKMFAERIRFDYRWFDAGWYPAPDGKAVESDWWGTVGRWEIDTVKWPGNSFRESVDFAHKHRMKTLVWFEPERVTHVEDLVRNCGYKTEWAVSCGHATANNIGNEECFQWTLKRILDFLEHHDIDMYREDNNCDPRVLWDTLSAREGADRVGIAENKSVVAHYRLWDSIIEFCARNGKDTFVDSCASGGGRNDLESLRRGIPLMRSDADRTTTALRLSMGTAFNRWVPFHGAACVEQDRELAVDGKRDKYIFRVSYNPILNLSAQWVQDPKTDFELIRFGIREWESVRDYLLKDFYLLTPWNGPTDRTHWTSYVYFDPEKDSGVLFAFRMEDAKDVSCMLKLTMLDPSHVYELRDADKGVIGTFTGSELAAGHVVTHEKPRSAALIFIRLVRE